MTVSNKKILLATHEVGVGEVMKSWLEGYGYHVDILLDGHGILDKILSNEYDLALLEVLMPNARAYDIVRNIDLKGLKTRIGILTCIAKDKNLQKEFPDKIKLFLFFTHSKPNILAKEIAYFLGDLNILNWISFSIQRYYFLCEYKMREYMESDDPKDFLFFVWNEAKKMVGIKSRDPLYKKALKLIKGQDTVSVSLLQRHLMVGYARGARILDEMHEDGYVSLPNASKPRKVLKK